MDAVLQLSSTVGVESACDVLGVARASFYRHRPLLGPALAIPFLAPVARPTPARALSSDERESVRAVLNSERFQDCSPAAIQATLLDEGQYLCSTRTMYRVLEEDGATRERRDQLVHPPISEAGTSGHRAQSALELGHHQAARPCQVDLLLPLCHPRRFQPLRRRLDGGACAKAPNWPRSSSKKPARSKNIQPDQLGLHADRGSAMRSKPVAFLLADLSVTKTHSRPYTSNDNPYSESQFRTMKYRPEFPDRFGCIQDSRAFCQTFFPWYNDDHRHSGIGMMTPAMVHYGLAAAVRENRQAALDVAYAAHPERFVRRPPTPPTSSQGGLDQQTNKLRRR